MGIKRTKGLIIVVSAPSGAGKSTLCRQLISKTPNITQSISYTTRPRRSGEKHGRDYFFVSGDKFKSMIKAGAFVEWACVHDHYYGTPRHILDRNIRSGIDTILNIDVQGGLKIRKVYPSAVLIFVTTPSFKELQKRLVRRGLDSKEVIQKRLVNARHELRFMRYYDYLVINDKIAAAVGELKSIITAEHRRLIHLSIPGF